jgi:ribonuclease HII
MLLPFSDSKSELSKKQRKTLASRVCFNRIFNRTEENTATTTTTTTTTNNNNNNNNNNNKNIYQE